LTDSFSTPACWVHNLCRCITWTARASGSTSDHLASQLGNGHP
jgi:hypothetical protein